MWAKIIELSLAGSDKSFCATPNEAESQAESEIALFTSASRMQLPLSQFPEHCRDTYNLPATQKGSYQAAFSNGDYSESKEERICTTTVPQINGAYAYSRHKQRERKCHCQLSSTCSFRAGQSGSQKTKK